MMIRSIPYEGRDKLAVLAENFPLSYADALWRERDAKQGAPPIDPRTGYPVKRRRPKGALIAKNLPIVSVTPAFLKPFVPKDFANVTPMPQRGFYD